MRSAAKARGAEGGAEPPSTPHSRSPRRSGADILFRVTFGRMSGVSRRQNFGDARTIARPPRDPIPPAHMRAVGSLQP